MTDSIVTDIDVIPLDEVGVDVHLHYTCAQFSRQTKVLVARGLLGLVVDHATVGHIVALQEQDGLWALVAVHSMDSDRRSLRPTWRMAVGRDVFEYYGLSREAFLDLEALATALMAQNKTIDRATLHLP